MSMRFFCALVRNFMLQANGISPEQRLQWRRTSGGCSGVTRQVTLRLWCKMTAFPCGRAARQLGGERAAVACGKHHGCVGQVEGCGWAEPGCRTDLSLAPCA